MSIALKTDLSNQDSLKENIKKLEEIELQVFHLIKYNKIILKF